MEYFPIVYSGVVSQGIVDETVPIDAVPSWFTGLRLNFAQNILFTGDECGRPLTNNGKEDNKIAVTEVREDSGPDSSRQISWGELRQRVGLLSQAMRVRGLGRGDRIMVVGSVCLDTLVVFLAITALGGVFCSCGTDMGSSTIIERLRMTRSKYLFMDDWAVYNQKKVDLRDKMREVARCARRIPEFRGIVAQARFIDHPANVSNVPNCQSWSTFLPAATTSKLVFAECEFRDPLLTVFSSGTTGPPKAIVHGVGGLVLNTFKEFSLHRSIDRHSIQLQYTTTSWIMYVLSISVLLVGARMIAYDGNPFVPSPGRLIQILEKERVTHLGINPRYLQTLKAQGILPREVADLSNLQFVSGTGMVLADSLFRWFYDSAFPPHVQLGNASGGTDLAGAFATANPLLPVYVGGCQSLSLGIPVKVYKQSYTPDHKSKGAEVAEGVVGELVATAAFPTMPVKLLNDTDGRRYYETYFDRFEHVWAHGDLIMIHPVTKQVMMLGRADGVLNPSGVRFGSAEIYHVLETKFHDQIEDSICVGQRRPSDVDESVVLFCLMRLGYKLMPTLKRDIRSAIRADRSPRHVPKYIFQVPQIPVSYVPALLCKCRLVFCFYLRILF